MSKKQLKSKAENLSTEVELLKSQLVRTLADYDNFRKRVEREEEEFKTVITAQLVRRLLPVFDMLYEAQKHLNDSGIALTIKELEETLKNEGIIKIEVNAGDEFTEKLHEAVEVVNDKDIEDNRIVKLVLTGWKFKDTDLVIRHAKVIVNKK